MILAAAASNPTTPTWLTITLSIVGGGVVGSLVSSYLTSSRDGRQARAKVQECLFETEDTRWTDTDYREFKRAASRLEAAALIAKAPHEIVRRYLYLADVAHYTQLAKEKENAAYPPRGLPLELAALVQMTIIILSSHLWHPLSKRRIIKHGVWLIDRSIESTKKANPDYTWNVQLFTWKPLMKEPGIRGVIHRRAANVARIARKLRSWIREKINSRRVSSRDSNGP